MPKVNAPLPLKLSYRFTFSFRNGRTAVASSPSDNETARPCHAVPWNMPRVPNCYNRPMSDGFVPEPKDHPGVIAPPPLIALATLLVGLVLSWLMPLYVLATLLSFWERVVLGAVLVIAGCVLPIAARRRFLDLGTNVEPWKPTLHLATTGVYRYVRNPMYVGLMLLVGGFGIGFASDWTLVLLVAMAFVLRHGVVLREERYLEAKFGDDYRRYKARVPRWGIW